MNRRGMLLGLLSCTVACTISISSRGYAGWPPDSGETSETAVMVMGIVMGGGAVEAGAFRKAVSALGAEPVSVSNGNLTLWRREDV